MTQELFGPVISSYSRAQAIEDGVLIDITEQARQQRFVFPMAMTSALWDRCTAENLRHVLTQLHREIKSAVPDCDQLKFVILLHHKVCRRPWRRSKASDYADA